MFFFFILINPPSYLLAFEQAAGTVIAPVPHSDRRGGRRLRLPPGGHSHTHFLLSSHMDYSGQMIQVEKVRRPTVLFVRLMSETHAAKSQHTFPRRYLSQPNQCAAVAVDTGGNHSAAVLSLHLGKINRQIPFKRDINTKKQQCLISSECKQDSPHLK